MRSITATLVLATLVLAGCADDVEEADPVVTDLRGDFVGLWNIEGCYGEMMLHATAGGITGTMDCQESTWQTWGNFREIAIEEDGAVRVSGTVNRAFPSGTIDDRWGWVAYLYTDGEVIFGDGNASLRVGDIYLEPVE